MITLKAFVVFSANGIRRTTQKPPALDFGEHACELKLTVPKALFTRPALSASITFDGPVGSNATAEVTEQVSKVLSDAGFNVRVEAIPQEAT